MSSQETSAALQSHSDFPCQSLIGVSSRRVFHMWLSVITAQLLWDVEKNVKIPKIL